MTWSALRFRIVQRMPEYRALSATNATLVEALRRLSDLASEAQMIISTQRSIIEALERELDASRRVKASRAPTHFLPAHADAKTSAMKFTRR